MTFLPVLCSSSTKVRKAGKLCRLSTAASLAASGCSGLSIARMFSRPVTLYARRGMLYGGMPANSSGIDAKASCCLLCIACASSSAAISSATKPFTTSNWFLIPKSRSSIEERAASLRGDSSGLVTKIRAVNLPSANVATACLYISFCSSKPAN